MSILAGFMVPHPPLIIPGVGKGEEKQMNVKLICGTCTTIISKEKERLQR